MRLAVAAGGPAPENNAYVSALLGELERGRGGARRAARASARWRWCRLRSAEAGLRRWSAARGRARRRRARRDLAASSRRSGGRVVERLPLPEYVVALGETELAAGRATAGGRDLALVRAEQRLQRRAGVDIDVELAVFEADHGSPRRAVDARARAPGRRRRACARRTRSAGR